ncbi:hypothetical protein CPB86DRAFT_878579 [Serendipita vermifera]|nr:hypothetical protein CPB86DRAFT_878579 [Serendipita vermifera]
MSSTRGPGGRWARKKFKCEHTCSVPENCDEKGYEKDSNDKLGKHQRDVKLHPNCDSGCPGYISILSRRSRKNQAPEDAAGSETVPSSEPIEHTCKHRLLWVLDPNESMESSEDARKAVHFLPIQLLKEELDPFVNQTPFDGYIFELQDHEDFEEKPGYTIALISENLEFYRLLPPKVFEKTVMRWETFRDIFLQMNLSELDGYDVIVPIGMGLDIRPESHGFATYGSITDFVKDLKDYDVKTGKFWPSIEESWQHGDKWLQVQRLEQIAREITLTPRPLSCLIDKGSFPTGSSIVVKRTYSDRSNHVVVGPQKKDVNRCKRDTPAHTMWFQQDLVESLIQIGEMRVGVTEGSQIVFRTHTRPNQDKTMDFEDTQRLGKIQGRKYSDILAQGPSVFDRARKIPPVDYEKFTEEFDTFVLKTVKRLIEMEEAHLSRQSSLRAFVRTDVGIMPDAEGIAHFFINEIERFPNVNMWRSHEHSGPSMATISSVLRDHLCKGKCSA